MLYFILNVIQNTDALKITERGTILTYAVLRAFSFTVISTLPEIKFKSLPVLIRKFESSPRSNAVSQVPGTHLLR